MTRIPPIADERVDLLLRLLRMSRSPMARASLRSLANTLENDLGARVAAADLDDELLLATRLHEQIEVMVAAAAAEAVVEAGGGGVSIAKADAA